MTPKPPTKPRRDPCLIGDGEAQRCPRCQGRGTTGSGHGHFGDCNGDAGEAWKPTLRLCPECLGRGVIAAQ